MGDVVAGFREVRGPALRAWLREDVADAARSQGLLDPTRLAAMLSQASGPEGRAHTALVSLEPGPCRVLLRSVQRGGLFGPWLGGALCGSERPFDELRATAALRKAGAPVPEPVLACAHRRFGPIWSAYVGTIFQEGTLDALAWLADAPSEERTRRAAAAAGAAVRRFHDAGGRHADLHVKNLLVRETEDGVEVLVIDLDKARVAGSPNAAKRMREIMRLYRSLRKRGVLERVGRDGLAAFLDAYVQGDEALRRALLRHLPCELRRVRLHALLWRNP